MPIGIAPMGIDGTVQLLTAYESNNFLRVVTGISAGTVLALFLGYIIDEYTLLLKNQRKCTEEDMRPPSMEKTQLKR